MASYPTSTKAFSTKTNGATQIIDAAHINEIQDEVMAISADLIARLAKNRQYITTAYYDETVTWQFLQTFTVAPQFSAGFKERGRSTPAGETTAWTPTRTAASGTWTGGTVSGVYWQIGKIVYYRVNIENATLSLDTISVTISLPFTASNLIRHAIQVYHGGVWRNASLEITSSTAAAKIERAATDAGVQPNIIGGAGFYLRCTFWHEIA